MYKEIFDFCEKKNRNLRFTTLFCNQFEFVEIKWRKRVGSGLKGEGGGVRWDEGPVCDGLISSFYSFHIHTCKPEKIIFRNSTFSK